jgi:excisionase family DNA binding protein
MSPIPPNGRLVWTIEEAAEIIGIGRNAAYRGVQSGDIPSLRIGRSWRIPQAALEKWLSANPNIAELTASARIAELEVENRRLKAMVAKVRKAIE